MAQKEGLSGSATRLWTSLECLRKAGLTAITPLVYETTTEDGWVMLRSGTLLIATCVLSVQDVKEPLAFAIALREPTTGSGDALNAQSLSSGVIKKTGEKSGDIRMTND
jgi:hypothetical protein